MEIRRQTFLHPLGKVPVMKEYQNFWLYFHLYDFAGVEWMDYDLPPPNFLLHTQVGAFIGWMINGFPGTKKSQEYFNDIIARFLLTFAEHRPERLAYRPYTERKAHKILDRAYELEQFQGLKSISLPYKVQERSETAHHIDQVFWAIKNFTEACIQKFGEGVVVPYQTIEDFAMRNFLAKKERSTLRAKCRSVWNWYNERNWVIPQTREFEMTRSERAKANAKMKYERAQAAVLGLVKGLIADEFKKKSGAWNITKIAKHLGMSRDTVRKHLKELQEEGLL